MIEFIVGPMFSEKSTELVSRLNRREIAGDKSVIIRPSIDNRGSLTHSNLSHRLNEVFVNTDTFKVEKVNFNNKREGEEIKEGDYIFSDNYYDCFGFDEIQFFSSAVVEKINFLADNKRTVVVSGLNGTAERETWETVSELFPFVDKITYKTGICSMCGSENGAFSFFKKHKTEKIVVGGTNDYTVLCRKCYKNMINGGF